MSAGKLNHEKSPDTVPIMSCKNFSSLFSFVPRKKSYTLRTKKPLGSSSSYTYCHISFFLSIFIYHSVYLIFYQLFRCRSFSPASPTLPARPHVHCCRVAIFYAALREPKMKKTCCLEFGRYRQLISNYVQRILYFYFSELNCHLVLLSGPRFF
jgi:hypothetical protein